MFGGPAAPSPDRDVPPPPPPLPHAAAAARSRSVDAPATLRTHRNRIISIPPSPKAQIYLLRCRSPWPGRLTPVARCARGSRCRLVARRDLVDEAPVPVFAGFERLDDRDAPSSAEVRGRVVGSVELSQQPMCPQPVQRRRCNHCARRAPSTRRNRSPRARRPGSDRCGCRCQPWRQCRGSAAWSLPARCHDFDGGHAAPRSSE